jgi:hypothetical protein
MKRYAYTSACTYEQTYEADEAIEDAREATLDGKVEAVAKEETLEASAMPADPVSSVNQLLPGLPNSPGVPFEVPVSRSVLAPSLPAAVSP